MKKNRDLIAGITVVLFSILYFISSLGIKVVDTGGITSVTYPRFLAGLLGLLGIMLIFQSQKSKIVETVDEDGIKKENIGVSSTGKTRVFTTILLLVFYALALRFLGFILTNLIYIFLQTMVLTDRKEWTRKNIVKAILYAVILTLAIYLIFNSLLKMVLPRGLIYF